MAILPYIEDTSLKLNVYPLLHGYYNLTSSNRTTDSYVLRTYSSYPNSGVPIATNDRSKLDYVIERIEGPPFSSLLEGSYLNILQYTGSLNNTEVRGHTSDSYKITEVINSNLLRISPPFFINKTDNYNFGFTNASGEISYYNYFFTGDTLKKIPIAKLELENIPTGATHVKIYRKSLNKTSGYEILTERLLEPVERLYDNSIFPEQKRNIGRIYDQSVIVNNYFSSSNSLSLTADSSSYIDSLKITGLDGDSNTSEEKYIIIKKAGSNTADYLPFDASQDNIESGTNYNSNFIKLYKNTSYELSFNAIGTKTNSGSGFLTFYFTGSTVGPSSCSLYELNNKIKISELEINDSLKYFGHASSSFKINGNVNGTLVIVPKNSEWTVGEISLKEIPYTPPFATYYYAENLVTTKNEAFNFLADCYGADTIPVSATSVGFFDLLGDSLVIPTGSTESSSYAIYSDTSGYAITASHLNGNASNVGTILPTTSIPLLASENGALSFVPESGSWVVRGQFGDENPIGNYDYFLAAKDTGCNCDIIRGSVVSISYGNGSSLIVQSSVNWGSSPPPHGVAVTTMTANEIVPVLTKGRLTNIQIPTGETWQSGDLLSAASYNSGSLNAFYLSNVDVLAYPTFPAGGGYGKFVVGWVESVSGDNLTATVYIDVRGAGWTGVAMKAFRSDESLQADNAYNANSADYATDAGTAGIANYAYDLYSPNSSTAAYADLAHTASYLSQTATASYALRSTSSSYATSSSMATTASYIYGGYQTIWVPASAMTPQTTNGAVAGKYTDPTDDIEFTYLAFEPINFKYAQFCVRMPESFQYVDAGSVRASFHWFCETAYGGVVWEIDTRVIPPEYGYDESFEGFGIVNDIGGNMLHQSDFVNFEDGGAVSNANVGGGAMWLFRVRRYVLSGSDTLVGDAKLVGVTIQYNTSKTRDD